MQKKSESKKQKTEAAKTVPVVETPIRTLTSIAFSDTNISHRYDDVFEWKTPNHVVAVRWTAGAYQFVCENGVALRVHFLSPHTLRFRYSPDGLWERDFSYAVSPDFKPVPVQVTLNESQHEYTLTSEQVQVVIAKSNLKVRIFDANDQLLHEDGLGYSARRTVMEGWNKVQLGKTWHRKTLFYGLGDKSSLGANLHGKKFENWCTDAYGFSDTSDPLYRAVPFFYVAQQGVAHGIFLDNTYRSHLDFDSQEQNEMHFGADGGELNYYFFAGPRLQDVAAQYHQLTGTHELPPMWALGYHQCRWSYYPEAKVKMIAENFRRLNIPCDAIYLDIDYMDRYQCFTWNKKYFPDPKQMIQTLKEMDFHTVVMIDPGLKENPDYEVYKDGLQKGHFVRTADGQVAKAPVWPGFCAFPDFTHPDARAWWGTLHQEIYNDLGVSGFWNDMSEPAVFYVNAKTLPDHVMHHYDGAPCSHKKAHNIYGQQMTRATVEGLKALQPEKRPFLLGRASFAGGQRYAALWTGDNFSTWEHLQMANVQCQRLAISGFSFCGTDIGGFAGEAEGELYTRWLQLSVFHPLMRTHSMGNHATGDAIDHPDPSIEEQVPQLPDQEGQEPWSFGEKWTQVARMAIELRYCLLPLIYTAFYQLKTKGTPVLRHLCFEDENDPKLADQDRDFMFGQHVLVSPVVLSKVQRQLVHLPTGTWYYFWTGQAYTGETFINVTQDQIPFFVRAGGVLVTFPIRQHTAEMVEEITLYCYYKQGQETTEWYEDEGEGYDYLSERYRLNTFETEGSPSKYTLNWLKTGNWSPLKRKVKVYLIGFPTFAKRCTVDGQDMPVKEIRLRDKSLYTITTDNDFDHILWQE